MKQKRMLAALSLFLCSSLPVFADEDWEEMLSSAQDDLRSGNLSQAEGKFKEAERLCEAVKLGPTDDQGFKRMSKGVADCLIGIATIRDQQGDSVESDRLYELAIRTVEKPYTANHLEYAKYLPKLADLYDKHGKADKAELVHQKIIDIRTKLAPKDDPSVVQAYDNYAKFLRSKSRNDEAVVVENKSSEMKYRNQN